MDSDSVPKASPHLNSGCISRAALERANPPNSGLAHTPAICTVYQQPRRCPACQTILAPTKLLATRADLVTRQIEAIGTADCPACGVAWLYVDCLDDCAAAIVLAVVERLVNQDLNYTEAPNRA